MYRINTCVMAKCGTKFSLKLNEESYEFVRSASSYRERTTFISISAGIAILKPFMHRSLERAKFKGKGSTAWLPYLPHT